MEIDTSFLSDEAIMFDDLDNCIIGSDQRGFLVYSYKKMLTHFSRDMPTDLSLIHI